MRVWQWLTRWRRPQSVRPTDAYVVCESGAPVVVCLDRVSVEMQTRGRSRVITRVHQVPIIQQGRE